MRDLVQVPQIERLEREWGREREERVKGREEGGRKSRRVFLLPL